VGERHRERSLLKAVGILVGFKVVVNRILIEAGRRLPPTFNYLRDAPDIAAPWIVGLGSVLEGRYASYEVYDTV
jgi:predicted RNA binding protein YcfA (HicA-like mRNA interferase family)